MEDNSQFENNDSLDPKKSLKDSAQKKIEELRGLTIGGILNYLRDLFDLSHGADEKLTVEEINNNIEFRGANLWILAFSIMIASIGLNTNSTAVIIGAMLISPLMGPIMGSGLAVGTNDFEMLKRSLRNLAVAVIIAVLTSTFYFLISPLSEAQSELLARTKPTFYDVGIALFGGLSGIVGASRKSKGGNVIPGVAIATALMPPLCTAGYGLATGKLSYFFGAFYLFFINSIFISLSTLFIVRVVLRFQQKTFMDKVREKRASRYIAIVVLITIIPSIWLGIGVVKEEVFNRKAAEYVSFMEESLKKQGTTRIGYKEMTYDSDTSNIVLSLDGKLLTPDRIEELKLLADKYELENTEVEIFQDNDPTTDIDKKIEDRLRAGMTETLYKKNEELLKNKDEKIEFLENELINARSNNYDVLTLTSELKYAFPQVKRLSLSKMVGATVDEFETDTLTTALAYLEKDSLNKFPKANFEEWLVRRLKLEEVYVIYPKYDSSNSGKSLKIDTLMNSSTF